jgi:hypothetical protein
LAMAGTRTCYIIREIRIEIRSDHGASLSQGKRSMASDVFGCHSSSPN